MRRASLCSPTEHVGKRCTHFLQLSIANSPFSDTWLCKSSLEQTKGCIGESVTEMQLVTFSEDCQDSLVFAQKVLSLSGFSFPGITLKCTCACLQMCTFFFVFFVLTCKYIQCMQLLVCPEPCQMPPSVYSFRVPQVTDVLHGFVGFLFQVLLLRGSPRRGPSGYIHWKEL